jgi:hypothetical protein
MTPDWRHFVLSGVVIGLAFSARFLHGRIIGTVRIA